MAPLNLSVQDMIDKYKLRKRYVKALFSYSLLGINPYMDITTTRDKLRFSCISEEHHPANKV